MTKRLSTMMLLLVGILVGMWGQTLVQDADGYYQIGTAADWEAFATMVDEGFSYVDARMTANINLGDCQTMIGSSAHPFGGVFDGQGHTLTVNYVSTDIRIAPFWYITGATIRNLHTAGTMQISGSAGNSGGGIAGHAQGVNTIEHCHSSVNITATGSGDSFGGIVGVNYRGTLTINDCIFDGSIVTDAKMHNGGFVGYTDNGTTTATNCLLTAVFDCGTGSNTVTFLRYSGTVTNCFYLNGIGVLQGTQITDAQLASGEIAYKLQAGRGKMFWGQTIGDDPQPVLTSDESKRVYRTMEGFSNTPDEGELQIDDDGYYLLGSANDWKRFAMMIDDGFANVNARMTADIDLGDDQTMVGNGHYSNVSYRKYFSGIFDGQGHTLTVHYVTDEAVQKMYTDLNIPLPSSGYYGFAPFVYVWGGTIRNLHTAGTITATHEGVAGIVGWTNGNTLIERCHSSVDITYTNGARGAAGLTYNSYNDNHVLTINDCIYDGTLTAGTNKTGSSGFVVYSWAGTTNISNSLLTATFANGMGSSDCATFLRNKVGTISNCHFLNPLGTIQGNQATADEIANGKVAFYLQNDRADLFWGQEIGTDPQPVLTSDESKRVYRSADGYTNDPTKAIADQNLVPLNYTRNSDNELTITGFDPGFTPSADFALVIPDDIDGSPVVAIANSAFYQKSNFTSLYIGKNVKTIGDEAFRQAKGMASVTFASDCVVESFGNSAFRGCDALTSFTMPNTVKTIGNDAFGRCASLPSITIPATVNSIGTSAFNGCSLLATVTFADGINLETIPASCFYECRALESISIPASVTKIDNEAFRRCSAMTSVIFPSNTVLTTIGDGAFRGCTELPSIVIPESVQTIGTLGFQACTNLEQVTLPSTLKVISPQLFQESKMSDDFVIPASVTTIGDNAFKLTTALGSITIPASVTSLGAAAFYAATGLEEVVFEDGIQLQQIQNETFRGSSIQHCMLPVSVKTIGNSAFYECKQLESVTLPKGLNSIGNNAFRYCEKLNDVTLPGSLSAVLDWAFANCTAMENLTIEEGVSNISRDVFQFSGMKNVVLPSTLDFIGVNLFYQCNQLEVLDLSKCVNVWELYGYTALRGGSYNITYGVPATTKIIMPPYAQATLGANDEVKTIDFDLTKDDDDFYLINNADDWDKFVAYSRANPTVNGRITADLDLTAHVGKLGVGNGESSYITWQGTLDGQGHTLTISYKNGKEFTGCLIAYAENATAKNLHVTGSVDVYYRVVGGIVGFVKPGTTLTIQDCESSVNFTVTPSTTNMHVAGFIGQGKTGDIYLTDCLYNGTITGVSSFRYAAGFMGWIENGGHTTYNYCLNNGTFTNMDMSYAYALGASQSRGMTTAAVCYGNIDGGAKICPENLYTPVSTDQLKTGMVAYRLQGGRDEQHWGQKLGTDPAPRLTTEDGTRVYRGQTYTNTPTEYTGLQKDADDYYLISGTADWEEFAALVVDFPLSNARMTADVEVTDNSMVGINTTPYSGIFDGQGHTLTINYVATENYCAPFNFISGATLKNLHTTGQISIGYRFGGGIVASSKGTNNMQNCWSSVNIVSSLNGDATHGGLVAYQENGTLTITNCLFDGSIVGEQSNRCGGFIGYRNGTLTIENSLCAPTSIAINEYDCGTLVRNGGGTITNCYFTQSLNSRDQGVKVTTEQLASGEIAFKLQGKSDDLIWAQTIGTDERPQLVVFNPTAQRVYRTLDGFSNNPDQAALKQDAEGYYLIGTVDDWKMLAILVDEGETDAKARMTADIDLGDDQTMIGSGPADADVDGSTQIKFQGIFDGQGHTLTINYVATEQITGPFRFIQEATIKNLHVKGTISTEYIHAGGIVGICFGQQKHSYIENCISSVNIISSRVNTGGFYGGSMHGGIIGKLQYYGQLHIDDCIFNGSISGETRDVVWGGFVGLPDGTVTISNSLQVGTFDCEGVISGSNGSGTFSSVFGNGYASKVNVDSNNYYLNQLGNAQGTKATAETLADGTVTTALQAGRAEDVWVQDDNLKTPMLKLFYKPYIPGDANNDGKVTITDAVAIVNFILGNPSPDFNKAAANVNGDYDDDHNPKITITDAVGVVNIILNSGTSAPQMEMKEPERMGEPE